MVRQPYLNGLTSSVMVFWFRKPQIYWFDKSLYWRLVLKIMNLLVLQVPVMVLRSESLKFTGLTSPCSDLAFREPQIYWFDKSL